MLSWHVTREDLVWILPWLFGRTTHNCRVLGRRTEIEIIEARQSVQVYAARSGSTHHTQVWLSALWQLRETWHTTLLETRQSNGKIQLDRGIIGRDVVLDVCNEAESNIEFFFEEIVVAGARRYRPNLLQLGNFYPTFHEKLDDIAARCLSTAL